MEQTSLFEQQTPEERNQAAAAEPEKSKYIYFRTGEKVTVSGYPYGRLKTEATFGTEYKKGKGYRTTFQTVNPKTGRINNVKRSTYSPLIIMQQDKETNFVNYLHADYYSNTGKQRFLQILNKHFNLFSKDQIKDFASFLIANTKADIIATLKYSVKPENQEAAFNKLKAIYKEPINLLTQIYKDQTNKFDEVIKSIDFSATDSVKDEGYNPFRVTETYIIGAQGMQRVENE